MYGGSGKVGRGRGGGPVKRNIHSTFQPPSVQRPSTTPGGGRLSTGGGHRNRNNTPAAPAKVSTADETFSLVRNHPLNFGMIIRLSPVLVEEIKRLEAQGGAARIKFDSSANNPAGNVIDVGGKEFKFTWSQETGDLCDIYEERQTGENGDGLLVESGGAWRKLNVQRELDESFKNHVKMRTEEAERKHKSRKAIVLDHGNPSMRNQMKDLAAVEVTNTWRGSYKQKKDPPFKKVKVGHSSAVIPPKSGGKAGLPSSTPSKVRASASPLLSTTPEQSGAPLSPLRNSSFTKVHANREDTTLTQSSKENANVSEKEMLSGAPASVVLNKTGSNERFGEKTTYLQSLLISLLMEKPQGMNLKALEKAIGETIPKSVKQIEPVLKKIAVFQAPGRYILKPDVELESLKKPLSENGSTPENNNHYREAIAPESSFPSKADDVKEHEEPSHLISEPYGELNNSEKIDIEHRSPDILSEKKIFDYSEGPAVSSSLSGSDSDSESDSSDSGSGSPSRSPVGSGSSSDSETDASSNSKEGSDEDVDIMSDDDKEPKQILLQYDPGLSTPPVPSTAPEVGYAPNMVDERDDGHGSDLVELEKDLFEDNQEADMQVTSDLFPDKDGDYADETTNLFNHHLDQQESEYHAKKVHNDKENAAKDGLDGVHRAISKIKSKRGSDEKHFDENTLAKRLKPGTWSRPSISMGRNSSSERPLSISPEGPNEGPYMGTNSQVMGRTVRDVSDYDYEKFDSHEFLGNCTSDSPRSIDLNTHAKAPASMERTDRHVEGLDLNIVKNSERGLQGNKEIRNEDGHSKDSRPPKNYRVGGDGGKHSGPHQKKHGSVIAKTKESGLVSMPQLKDSPIDNYRTDIKNLPIINGRGATLRRELSELEMGELRENLNEEASGAKKLLERNNSFKQSENKSSSDYWNLDASKTAKESPLPPGIGISSNLQSLPKKTVSEDHVDDFTSLSGKTIQRETQSLSRVDHSKTWSQHHKFVKENSKGRHNDAGARQEIGSEGYPDSQRKVHVGASQKHEKQVIALTTRDNRRQKSNDLGGKKKDFWLVDSRDNGQRGEMDSGSDDSITSYAKYEKEEPEMRGPINDLSQYNQYVQEYREKYDCYHTLNKILESYRKEFQTFGRDLELAKGRDNDRYNKVLEQLMESYHLCGSKHKRLKKIFVVLHHEVQHLKEMIRDFADKQTKG